MNDDIVPELIVVGAAAALEFYTTVFGAREVDRMPAPDGRRLMHSEIVLNGRRIFVCDEFAAHEGGTCKSPQTLGGTGTRLNVYVDDADAVVARAVAAGARVLLPVQEMFWGGRYGKIVDPFGHEWGLNQQLREQTLDQTHAAAEDFFARRQ